MLLGMLQFYFTSKIFGDIGDKPEVTKAVDGEKPEGKLEFEGDRYNPFTSLDKIMVAIAAFIGVTWVINDPISKIGGVSFLEMGGTDISGYYILVGFLLFITLLISRITRYPTQTRDRMIAIVVFAIMTVVFWMCFEQAG